MSRKEAEKKKRLDKKIAKEKKRQERLQGLNGMGKDLLSGIREMLTGEKAIDENNASMQLLYHPGHKRKKNSSYYAKYIVYPEEIKREKHSPYSKGEWISFGCFAATLCYTVAEIILLIYSYLHLHPKVFTNNAVYLVVTALLPFLGWVYATDQNYWAFHKRKRIYFELCLIHFFLVILQPVYSLCRRMVVPIVFRIPTNPVLTVKMLMLLAYIIIAAMITAMCIVVYIEIEPLLTSAQLKKQIELFKLGHIVDNRKDKKYKYDVKTVKSLESGEVLTIKENDRYLQGLINGPSGTGKTSTLFENIICRDWDQKITNRQKRQEEMLALIEQKKATIKGPLREFREDAVIPIGKNKSALEKNQKELEKIRNRYQDCGTTVIAPNASMIEDLIRLAYARGLEVNVLDPINHYGKYPNVREVKINPFYVPLELTEEERVIYITNASMVFADVLIATNQSDGDSDTYFTDIALAVSSNIAAVVMLAKNIRREQAYIDDIQECMSNFSKLDTYVQEIENHYNISVKGTAIQNKKKLEGDDLGRDNNGTIRNNGKKNPYYYQILFVKQELMGAGSEDMFSQARGLRNLIAKVLQDPRIRTKLSAREEEERLDFDKILSGNQITLVNTAIELGKSVSTSFGLFFLLLHRVSVLRRPMATRTPNFLWIDEATQYMHPVYEDIISLYRQYRVAAFITLQSLTQTEKSRSTAYLKNVFMGAGTHIVFGRLSPEEMELYSKMGGINREMQEQESFTRSSIWSSSPAYSESVRSTPTMTNVLEGADLRILDFLELTIFTVDSGRVLPGQLGRVFFIGEEEFDKKRFPTILWKEVVPEAFMEESDTEEVFLTAGDLDEDAFGDIPETEKEYVVKQTNESNPLLNEEAFANLSLADMFLMAAGGTDSQDARSDTQARSEKPKGNETVSEMDDDEEEIDYATELKKLDGKGK